MRQLGYEELIQKGENNGEIFWDRWGTWNC
jgi:hypothetical protein